MLKLYKKMGETPLECLERWKKANPEHKNTKMTYAGRLDPMAEGELLVLLGEECKEKEKYLGLDKEYEFEVLFGFQTDTYDVLGFPHLALQALSKLGITLNPHLALGALSGVISEYDVAGHRERIERFLEKIRGKQTQTYPPFSSKTIGGKPLFELTKKKGQSKGQLPEREIEIYEADFIKSYWIKGRDLKADIFKRVLMVRGDFRQEEILQRWEKVLKGREQERFLISKFKVVCSSGTYVRGLVNSLSERINYPAVTFWIKRTKIFV